MCRVGWFFKFKWMEQKILIVETVNELQSAYCLQWYFLELILWFPSHNTLVLSSQAATCAHTPQRNTQSLVAQESTRARWHEHDHRSIRVFSNFFYWTVLQNPLEIGRWMTLLVMLLPQMDCFICNQKLRIQMYTVFTIQSTHREMSVGSQSNYFRTSMSWVGVGSW